MPSIPLWNGSVSSCASNLLARVPMSSTTQLCLGSAFLGVFSHQAVYIRGEWHLRAPRLVQGYSLVAAAIFGVQCRLGTDVVTSLARTGLIAGSYAAALFSSIIIYRRFFHRLRHFPGPPIASLTKFWHVWKSRNGQNHLLLEQLHEKYGPVIRTGPEELTIIDPAVMPAVDGFRSECTKAVWYDMLHPTTALNTTRDKPAHDARRRIWDRGFSPKALAAYEGRVQEYAVVLSSRIDELARQGARVNVTDWFYWFTLDVMGEFAFGRSFDMLRDEEWHYAVQLLRKAMSLVGPFSPVPWLAQIGFKLLPGMIYVRDWFAMVKFCRGRMDERIQMKGDKPDVAHWLIQASLEQNSLQQDIDWLTGDALTLIIAGSDTMAATLVLMFYELARTPYHQELLLSEFRGINIADRHRLQYCAHLNACLNETMRLHPTLMTGGYRQAPPQGITIGNTYIPGNTTIVSPRYSLGRLETSYEQATEWIPERWTTRPELVKDNRGFSPFALGRYNCVGKTVAMSEMRYITALLVTRFEVFFAPGETGQRLFEDLRDQFTASPGRLELQFRRRE
ncbi:cytochrome P450 [Stachybotrys elegans]|uniref:Cytochrome P450 n=1 Tax=Stachybotrys elegans TaxID=80388 RepID=A0A8K0SJ67_9HYPO|nr:cytochrome P450 [Stachybotrys elegans]